MTTNLLAILTSAAEGTLGELTAGPRAGRGVPRQPCSHRRRRPHQRRQWPARIENQLLISRRTPSVPWRGFRFGYLAVAKGAEEEGPTAGMRRGAGAGTGRRRGAAVAVRARTAARKEREAAPRSAMC
jgi:hypothetical protein